MYSHSDLRFQRKNKKRYKNAVVYKTKNNILDERYCKTFICSVINCIIYSIYCDIMNRKPYEPLKTKRYFWRQKNIDFIIDRHIAAVVFDTMCCDYVNTTFPTFCNLEYLNGPYLYSLNFADFKLWVISILKVSSRFSLALVAIPKNNHYGFIKNPIDTRNITCIYVRRKRNYSSNTLNVAIRFYARLPNRKLYEQRPANDGRLFYNSTLVFSFDLKYIF